MKHEFKVGDIVTVAKTANYDKYVVSDGPGWGGDQMRDIVDEGSELIIVQVNDGSDRLFARLADDPDAYCWTWFVDDLVPAVRKKYAERGIYCIVDDKTRPIVNAAVAGSLTGPCIFFDNERADGYRDANQLKEYAAGEFPVVEVPVLEFIERAMNGYKEQPLKYRDWMIGITDNEVTIGCTTVSRQLVLDVAKRIDQTFHTKQGECRFDDTARIMKTGEYELPYELILAIAKKLNK